MSGFTRTASRLTCGAICWLSACSLMAGWTITKPEPGDEVPLTGEVEGQGAAAGANLSFFFKIVEFGEASNPSPDEIIQESGSQATETTSWNMALGPPDESTWPVGEADAALYAAGALQAVVTIEFVEE